MKNQALCQEKYQNNCLYLYSIISAFLGMFIGICLCLLFTCGDHGIQRITGYLSLVALFHLLEFILTAVSHPDTLTIHSFLLDHSHAYWAATILSLLESLVLRFLSGSDTIFFAIPMRKNLYKTIMGLIFPLIIALVGQTVRSASMFYAGQSFTHIVAKTRENHHQLVTNGPYSYVRHPAYSGFYIWVFGCQLLLGNVISLLILLFIMNRFFIERIADEEAHLIHFFGKSYLIYRKGKPSGVPFVP